ncbi:hypothetical protein L2E82_30203 [Cichorium intybus]|uniref:Uncharacterized protein n=1 Tax=Cichorium intybus TaxID=13427 RepID=A0ACB9CZM2_CICIN|nr:hypothetical protein L2E82_30203 [Cichorium intybus]
MPRDSSSFKVPLGNFELDWLIHTADVFFARALRDQQQILWVSDNGIPDLGGDNEEETCYSDEMAMQPKLTVIVYSKLYKQETYLSGLNLNPCNCGTHCYSWISLYNYGGIQYN